MLDPTFSIPLAPIATALIGAAVLLLACAVLPLLVRR